MKTIHMDSLRMAINPAWKHKIPPNESGAYDNIAAVSQWGREHLGFFDVLVTKSSTIGARKRDQYRECPDCLNVEGQTIQENCASCGGVGRIRVAGRNWLGTGKHRIHIVCPECNKLIPAGRLAQHYKYKHSHECDKCKGMGIHDRLCCPNNACKHGEGVR